jgi:hypothetical protein
MKQLRLFVALAILPVGCFVDEDTNSAVGSRVEVTGTVTELVEDSDGIDGVIVDCSSLFSSNVSIDNGSVRVDVSFDAGTVAGTRLDVGEANVQLSADGGEFPASGGVVVVDANDTGVDMRIVVTLENVTTVQGHTVNGQIDCLETTGDSLASSCASACTGGGGDDDFDVDSD